MEKPSEHTELTNEQLQQYLDYINLPSSTTPPSVSLAYLTKLIQHHVSTIPFDNLYLHYNGGEKYPSLEPEKLFKKCVGTHRGGFCIEQNRLFGQVLEQLGFKFSTHGARVHSVPGNGVNAGDWYFGWTHMVLLVHLDTEKFLCDVGFGGAAPTKPIPLQEGATTKGWGEQELRLAREVLEGGGVTEGLWIYEQRPSPQDSFTPVYAFSMTPFLPQDYAVINHYVSTHPSSWFTFQIVCMKFIMENEELVGMMIMNGNEFYRKTVKEKVELLKCETEEQRVEGLEKYFGIVLDEEEQGGIQTKESRLRG